ncbi:uncharacterized protein LOC136082822 [Hydra vulgaris]|uniref:Uncharacterized protein LOC136082822 n=1 Tax=Hydra vulgaris TaxID=6087 RepID=A0ABM4C9G5_HYDVU
MQMHIKSNASGWLMFAQRYPWYYMPQSLHKILLYGHVVLRRMLLPIGMFSERVQEARNKNFKRFHENYTRKCSRSKTNYGVLCQHSCLSNPIISSMRRFFCSKAARLWKVETDFWHNRHSSSKT